MAWYVGRRVLQMIPVFFGATLLVYALVFLLPGDPIAALGGNRPLAPAVVAQLRHTYHLDRPFLVQYLLYLKGIVHWDFGTSYSGRAVSDVMTEAFPVTIRLALLALLFEGVLGIAAGLLAGLRRGGFLDASLLVASLVVIAVPIFVIGFVVQIVFGVKLGWINPTVGPEANWSELVVPAMVLGSVSFAYVLRLTRDSTTENLSADWVRTAAAKGLSRRRVVTTHVLRNSLIPVATFLGADLGSLMGGAIITEGIFNIPGVGHALFQAIERGENSTVVSIVTVLVIIYIATSLLIDLLYAVLDPRIRYV
ncbi:MAG: oligopeptide transport system permease protein [Blastococcus sp.]|nr:oligopeptide transport system permease protein [Blastococcus sp.]